MMWAYLWIIQFQSETTYVNQNVKEIKLYVKVTCDSLIVSLNDFI